MTELGEEVSTPMSEHLSESDLLNQAVERQLRQPDLDPAQRRFLEFVLRRGRQRPEAWGMITTAPEVVIDERHWSELLPLLRVFREIFGEEVYRVLVYLTRDYLAGMLERGRITRMDMPPEIREFLGSA